MVFGADWDWDERLPPEEMAGRAFTAEELRQVTYLTPREQRFTANVTEVFIDREAIRKLTRPRRRR